MRYSLVRNMRYSPCPETKIRVQEEVKSMVCGLDHPSSQPYTAVLILYGATSCVDLQRSETGAGPAEGEAARRDD